MVVRPIAKLDEEARRNNDLVTELRCLRRRNGQLHSAGINSRTDSIPVRRPVVPRVPRQKQSSSVEAHCNTRRAHRGAARAIATPPTRNSHMISRSSPKRLSTITAGAVLAARHLSSGVVLAQFHPRRRSAYATG